MRRLRASVLVPVVAIFGLLLASAAPLAQATVAVTASVNVHTTYLDVLTNTKYTFAVTNSSTAGESIGSVQITTPSTAWTLQGCGPAPAGWSPSGVGGTCTFNSTAGAADNIAPGATKHFSLLALTGPGSADVTGLPWPVSVNQADTYSSTGAASATPTTANALTTTIYTWQVTGAVVRHSASNVFVGTSCPAAESSASASAAVDIVVCGENHANGALQAQAANSSLSGTFLAKRGTLASGLVAQGAADVVLGTYSASKVTATAGSGLTLVAKIGSSATQTSPRLTITGFTAAATSSWPRFRYDNLHSATNPNETLVGLSNVATLVQWWSLSTGSSPVESSPAVVNGTVYVGSGDGHLYALAAGTGAIKWTAAVGNGAFSSPAVVNGVVYVGGLDDKLYAFDARGVTNCSGAPKTCSPLWTGTTVGQIFSSPAVASGVVYIASTSGLYAFDAAGVTGCSGTPTTCTPLWTAPTGQVGYSSPAVANGVVYIGAMDDKLYAFSAGGTTGCSGAPKTCVPLWTATTGAGIQSSPSVAHGVVYVGSEDDKLYAFSAAGATNCSGTPKTCSPLWTGATGGMVDSSPAVANGVVYVGSNDTNLYAFDASGTSGCSGTPTTCSPLWTGGTGGAIASSPSVANGVVYVGGGFDVYAFDAAGVIGCSGAPKTCNSVWSLPENAIVQSAPTVVNGGVYAGDNGGGIYAYGLP